MAWRPTEYLIEGELDNTVPNKVTGWMRFLGKEETVTFDLTGNFHRDIRGARIRFTNEPSVDEESAKKYVGGIRTHQTGKAGDITAGLPPADYVSYPYLEFYTDQNGRMVIELRPEQVEILTRPIPACESDPISREEQDENLRKFIEDISRSLEEKRRREGSDEATLY
jgi:hypothetical protein